MTEPFGEDLSTVDGPCDTTRYMLEIIAEAEVVRATAPPDPEETP